MRTYPSALLATAPLATAVLTTLSLASLLAGCGAGDSKPSRAVEVASTINYGSFGTTAEIDCADGKSLNVEGSNNTLNVKGSCTSVSVGGADNKIKVARIDQELSVVGLNNTITYVDGSPDVDDAGSGNRISEAETGGRG